MPANPRLHAENIPSPSGAALQAEANPARKGPLLHAFRFAPVGKPEVREIPQMGRCYAPKAFHSKARLHTIAAQMQKKILNIVILARKNHPKAEATSSLRARIDRHSPTVHVAQLNCRNGHECRAGEMAVQY